MTRAGAAGLASSSNDGSTTAAQASTFLNHVPNDGSRPGFIKQRWFLDSCTSKHVSFDVDNFDVDSYTPDDGNNVILGSEQGSFGQPLQGTGSVPMEFDGGLTVTMTDVAHSNLITRLLSLTLLRKRGVTHRASDDGNGWYFYAPDGRLLFVAHLFAGLYATLVWVPVRRERVMVTAEFNLQAMSSMADNKTTTTGAAETVQDAIIETSPLPVAEDKEVVTGETGTMQMAMVMLVGAMVWILAVHRRLNHIHVQRMRYLRSQGDKRLQDFSPAAESLLSTLSKIKFCSACSRSKIRRKALPGRSTTMRELNQRVNSDSSGKKPTSHAGNHFAQIFTEDRSRVWFIYFSPAMDSTVTAKNLRHYDKLSETITGNRLQQFQRDGGSEYKGGCQKYVEERGIETLKSASEDQGQNAVAERPWGMLGEAWKANRVH